MMLFNRVKDFIIPETLYHTFRSCHPFCLAVLNAVRSIIFPIFALEEEQMDLFSSHLLFLPLKLFN